MRRQKDIYDRDRWIYGIGVLLKSTNYGLLLSSCALLLGTITLFGHNGYEHFIEPLVKILRNINDHATDYYYYMTPCPWLQIKIYQILQVMPAPRDRSTIEEID